MSDADDISRNATQTEEGQSGLQGAVQSGNIREEQIANAVAFLSHPKVSHLDVHAHRCYAVIRIVVSATFTELNRVNYIQLDFCRFVVVLWIPKDNFS